MLEYRLNMLENVRMEWALECRLEVIIGMRKKFKVEEDSCGKYSQKWDYLRLVSFVEKKRRVKVIFFFCVGDF